MSKRSYDSAFSGGAAFRRGGRGRKAAGGAAAAAADAAAAAAMLTMAPYTRPSNQQLMAAAVRAQKKTTELKGVDTSIAIADVLATTNTNVGVLTLNLIVPGNGSFNRVGRKVRLQSARMFGQVFATFAAAGTTGTMAGATVRMILVWDKQPSGVLPTFDTIFGTTIADGTEATAPLDPLKFDNTARFRVLRDVRKSLNPKFHNAEGGTEDYQYIMWCFDEFVKLPSLETVYSGQSSPQTIADISSGALYFIARATTNTSNVTEMSINNSFCRVRYTDA